MTGTAFSAGASFPLVVDSSWTARTNSAIYKAIWMDSCHVMTMDELPVPRAACRSRCYYCVISAHVSLGMKLAEKVRCFLLSLHGPVSPMFLCCLASLVLSRTIIV